MQRLFYQVSIALFLLTSTTAWAQRDFAQAEIEVTQVDQWIYMLSGPGGNIAVSAGADGLLMVDAKFAPLADKIQAALHSLDSGALKFLLNTHFHGDHTGGNQAFGPAAPIIAHTNVRQRLMQQRQRGDRIEAAKPQEAWPVITFDQSLSIHFNGEEVRALHLPNGHTDGDLAVFFKGANVVHMGDHFFAGRFPFVDLDSGGDVEGLRQNISMVLEQLPPDIKIIPGHGPLSTVEDLRTYHHMLVETIATIRQGIDSGQTLAQLQTAGVGDDWATWGSGFISTEAWIETIHRSLTR